MMKPAGAFQMLRLLHKFSSHGRNRSMDLVCFLEMFDVHQNKYARSGLLITSVSGLTEVGGGRQ